MIDEGWPFICRDEKVDTIMRTLVYREVDATINPLADSAGIILRELVKRY